MGIFVVRICDTCGLHFYQDLSTHIRREDGQEMLLLDTPVSWDCSACLLKQSRAIQAAPKSTDD